MLRIYTPEDSNHIANIPAYVSVKQYCLFAVFDLELTGLNGDEDRVIEPAIVLCDQEGKPLFAWETLINPWRDTGPVHIHNITNGMVANAPKFQQIVSNLVELFNGRIIVGLNNTLDFQCLKREMDEVGIKFDQGDSLDLSALFRDSMFIDEYEKEINQAINSQDIEHRAMPDAMVAAAILPLALEFAREHPKRVKQYTKCTVTVRESEQLTL